MDAGPLTIVALSGGVDSAVAAWLLREAGHAVECLHMSNWDDDDGYCDAAGDLKDARQVADRLGLPLHRVSFAREYRESVFAAFLAEARAGRTPNPDVHCNREIKFGLLRRYVWRLGAGRLATGHYARVGRIGDVPVLLRGRDAQKDQSYFLSTVDAADLDRVEFPLGELDKNEVRRLAASAGLRVAAKRDSTGICFVGERPYAEFLGRFIAAAPGNIVTADGTVVGEHEGLHRYTIGQRKGIGLGGLRSAAEAPWYVAAKLSASNELVVVQGHDHPSLLGLAVETAPMHFVGPEPAEWTAGTPLRCQVRARYRQPDQAATLLRGADGTARIEFDRPQRALTPGQFAVVYVGERCLGAGQIERVQPGARIGFEARETARSA
jgi:tRNA-specific 2-thiouridylase